ncbi:hypothetical protein PLEOSDRAFT_1114007 [Pleurotus ostreatus PC15]|uniref:O-methyltransferase C-terminal domain-containing protein n=1 Tax=Pleurotus ostreatus (strain PC15) TaxID=1137138 RepID=A0A067NAT9_PLEO1|nr:hypothetical protein PLEOSDRAFT_1114007 [Pleurotus ostreatus PC15]
MTTLSPSEGKAQIRALLNLINTSAEQAIAEYDKQGCDIPSLTSGKAHPMDDRLPSLELKNTLRVLEGACAQLCVTLAPPAHTMLNYSMDVLVPSCISTVIQAGIAPLLAKHPKGLHIDVLSKETGIHPQKLATILRLLILNYCFQEVESNVFANNRLSLTLLPETSVVDILDLKTGEMHRKATLWVYDALVDPDFGPTYDGNKSPLVYALRREGFDGSLYDYLQTQPGAVARFARAMLGFSVSRGLMNLLNVFPWQELAPGSTVCDLGGGNGNTSIEIAKKFPHLKVHLQDLPDTIEEAKVFWKEEYPDAIKDSRVAFTPIDFFKQAPVPDQDIYYISQIVHNWGDEDCITLLKNIRSAMSPKSRLLINDYLASHLDETSIANQHPSLPRAPYPLSPGFGRGMARTYTGDYTMLVVCNSRERSLEDFIELCSAADLKFVRVWDLAETSVTEFVPA